MWYWLFKYVFMGPLLSLLGRPKVEGLEYVPHSGPAILASNHLAVADSFYLPLVVRRRITFLAKAEYFTGTGLKGWFQRVVLHRRRAGADRPHRRRHRAGRARHRRSASSVEGKLLGMYPEGTRSPDGRLYKGKTGLARLALETGVPVIPVAMIGTDVVNPPGQQDVAVRPGHGPVRQADGLLPVRRAGRQPLHRAGGHRRGDLRADAAVRSGIRRHLRRRASKSGNGRLRDPLRSRAAGAG